MICFGLSSTMATLIKRFKKIKSPPHHHHHPEKKLCSSLEKKKWSWKVETESSASVLKGEKSFKLRLKIDNAGQVANFQGMSFLSSYEHKIQKTSNDRNLSSCRFGWSLPARLCAPAFRMFRLGFPGRSLFQDPICLPKMKWALSWPSWRKSRLSHAN